LAEDIGLERDDNCERHVHTYIRETDIADEHQHVIMGVSGPMRGEGTSHIHRLRIRTSYVDGHWHWFDVMSGPAIEIPDDNHVHYYTGNTTVDEGHSHHVEGVTGVAPIDYAREEDDDEEEEPPIKIINKKHYRK
jgi:hypothetical protein